MDGTHLLLRADAGGAGKWTINKGACWFFGNGWSECWLAAPTAPLYKITNRKSGKIEAAPFLRATDHKKKASNEEALGEEGRIKEARAQHRIARSM